MKRQTTLVLAILFCAVLIVGCALNGKGISKQDADAGLAAAQAVVDTEQQQLDGLKQQLATLPTVASLQKQVADLKAQSTTQPSSPELAKQATALSAEVQQVSTLQKEANSLETQIIPKSKVVVQTATAVRDATYSGDYSGLGSLGGLLPPPWNLLAGLGIAAATGFIKQKKIDEANAKHQTAVDEKDAALNALSQYAQATHANVDMATAHQIAISVDAATRAAVNDAGVLPVQPPAPEVKAVTPLQPALTYGLTFPKPSAAASIS